MQKRTSDVKAFLLNFVRANKNGIVFVIGAQDGVEASYSVYRESTMLPLVFVPRRQGN